MIDFILRNEQTAVARRLLGPEATIDGAMGSPVAAGEIRIVSPVGVATGNTFSTALARAQALAAGHHSERPEVML